MISTAIIAILSATRGKLTIGSPNCTRVVRVGERQLHRGLRDADGARRGLDARRLEGLHQLLEAEPLDAAEQILGLHLKAVEGDLVFLHAAIAEHLDLGAGHAGGRERILVGAARLLGEQHGEAAIALLRSGRCAPAASSGRRAPDG